MKFRRSWHRLLFFCLKNQISIMSQPNKKTKTTHEKITIQQTQSFEGLSADCLSHILSLYSCSLLDIFRLSLVCKKLNHTLEDDRIWNDMVEYLYVHPRWLERVPNSLANEKIALGVECLKDDYWIRQLIMEHTDQPTTKLKLKHIMQKNCQSCHQRKTCTSHAFKINTSIIKPLTKNSIAFEGSLEPNVCFHCLELCCNKTSCVNHFLLTDSEISRMPHREMKSNYGSTTMLYALKNVCMLSIKKYPHGIEQEIQKKEQLKLKKQKIKQLKNEIKQIV